MFPSYLRLRGYRWRGCEPVSSDDRQSECNAEPVAIAIVGLAFRFPQGTTTCDGLWKMIYEARSASSDFPPDRLNGESFYHPDEARKGSIPVRGGNFIEGNLGAFDAPFFSVTPSEAACMDPQHRLLLETTFHALEDAGIPLSKCSGSDTSVFTGCFTNDYLSILQQDYELEQRHAAVGIAPSMLANRISWFFNFKGTSMNIDSACSSSLVALHLACEDLRSGCSSMALAGGANLVYHPNFMKILSRFNFLSPDSRCWSFDERANGYSRGEGTAMIVLKRLNDAVRDGDTIRAVIRATGTNQDGRTPGISQPDLASQVSLIRRTFQQAKLEMGPTRFFEAHGTGTVIGDVTEANAIGQAFQLSRTEDDPLYIGAVKANIGHLEGASGLAGVIKAILVLENAVIPPIAGLEVPNQRIDSRNLHIRLPTIPTPWPTSGLRRACVSSFGFGGTNAIVVLDDAYNHLQLNGLQGYHRTRQTPPEGTSSQHSSALTSVCSTPSLSSILAPVCQTERAHPKQTLLIVSAADKQGAEKLAVAYRDYVKTKQCDALAVALALSTRRTLFSWRSFLVVDKSTDGLSVSLSDAVRARDNTRIAFIFTGQGAQTLGMGSALFDYPVFQKSIEKCGECLRRLGSPWSLEKFLKLSPGSEERDISAIDSPAYSQPLTTCLQIALVDLLESIGIAPTVVIGHSSGEIAAAYAVGGLSRSSAVRVAYSRGMLAAQLAEEGNDVSMMAVGLSRDDIRQYIDRIRKATEGTLEVSIGCVNSAHSVTLTGNIQQLELLQQWLAADSVFARRLRVPVAYHSPHMQPIAEEYRAALQNLKPRQGNEAIATMVSSVTGDTVALKMLCNADYWVNNLTETVEFERALTKLLSLHTSQRQSQITGSAGSLHVNRVSHLLEVGPHNTLEGSVRETVRAVLARPDTRPEYIPLLRRGRNAHTCLLMALGRLHSAGHPVEILAANGGCPRDGCRRPMGVPLDMPAYPFNHSKSYWKEGRLSKNFRFRSTPRHDLLGSRALDWNRHIAQWRNILRVSELPWLEDHQVDGQTVVPATAMVVMAVEATRQLLDARIELHSIDIKEVNFLHAMRFKHATDELETQFTLFAESHPTVGVWSQFRLFVIDGEQYVECCRGSIRANNGAHSEGSRALILTSGEDAQSWMSRVSSDCRRSKPPYGAWNQSAIRYGPRFQNLKRLRVGSNGEATACLETDKWKSNPVKDDLAAKYLIHPSTMDGLAQLIAPALNEAYGKLPTFLPTGAASIHLDCRALCGICGDEIYAVAQCDAPTGRGVTSTIVSAARDSAKPLVVIQGLEARFVDAVDTEGNTHTDSLCTKLLWRPSITMMNDEQVRESMLAERPEEDEWLVEHYQAMNLAIQCFIEQALEFVGNPKSFSGPEHLQRYVLWMERWQQSLAERCSREAVQSLLADEEKRELLVSRVESSGPEGQLFMLVGRSLRRILSGDANPLELIFRDGLADRYYEQVLANPHHAHPVAIYLKHLCFENPAMRIIEIGAGTGGMTLRCLEALASDGLMKCARYDYTDISPVFFARAEERFQEYTDVLRFSSCDISQNPGIQGFELASYDLVIASHVLHATRRLDEAVANTRKLLKPGGKLVLLETTEPDTLHLSFGFGVLTGWSDCLRYETRSEFSPCITTSQWHQRLKANGFSGVDVEVPGQKNEKYRYSSIIISTAIGVDAPETDPPSGVALVVNADIQYQLDVATTINQDRSWPIVSLSDANTFPFDPSTTLVFLIALHDSVLEGLSRDQYGLLKAALGATRNTLWVGQPLTKEDKPYQRLVEGLGRALASEDYTRKFVTLLVDQSDTKRHIIGYIPRLVEKIKQCSVDDLEANYIASDGILSIPRVSDDSAANQWLTQFAKSRRTEEVKLSSATRAALSLGPPGRPQKPRYIEYEQESLSPGEDEIIVRVEAFGLTLRDYLAYCGKIDELSLGSECAGVITYAGSEAGYALGDRVLLIGTQLARTHVRTKAGYAVSLPDSMSFTEAASLPVSLWTAYYTLENTSRLDQNETVLVLNASSCVGQMLVQLAMHRGARVLVTVDTPIKKEFICKTFGVSRDHIILEDDPSLAYAVRQITSGQGLDVLIGCLEDYDLSDLSGCLAPGSRVVDLSPQSMKKLNLTMSSFPNNVSYSSIDMREILVKKPLTVQGIFCEAIKYYLEGDIKPPQPLHVFAAGDMQAAFDSFSSRDRLGKRVVELADGSSIRMDLLPRPLYTFDAHSTYVIAGGLGGIGRSIARWMVSVGVRSLVLLSRSGASTDAKQDLIRELKEQGVSVAAPKLDISNFPLLADVLQELGKTMHPVRGCILASMTLRDNLFANMEHEDWTVSIDSKVAGSWNLHKALPQNLDFFILLASLNGIFGNWSQANYAAGNSFQDALARYRVSEGQKAVSIDLGVMVSDGVVAENASLRDSMRRVGLIAELTQEHLFALLDHYCNPNLPVLAPDNAQLLVGIETPSVLMARGHDLHHSIRRPMFSHLFRRTIPRSSQTQGLEANISPNRPAILKAASAYPDQRTSFVLEWTCSKVSQVLGIPIADISPEKPIHIYGIDSLVAVDLKNWFEREIGARITVLDLMGNVPLHELCATAAQRSRYCS
ncbi:putative polyketide synthase [Aspergillus spinulosporus]